MSHKWTASQRDGITSAGSSLLVSAAAGSGKTSVLTERCVYLVCDAEPACEVDELLVVTFTESAAAEMRERIGRALRDRGNAEGTRTRRQIALLDHAQISTVHSFCARLLRQNFNLAGVDPALRVLDQDEARLLKLEVARDLFEEHYEGNSEGAFHELIDNYGNGEDAGLVEKVIRTHELLSSLVDPGRWIADCRGRLREAGDHPLEKSELGRRLLEEIKKELRQMKGRCARSIAAMKALRGFDAYLTRLEEFGQIIAYWGTLGLDDLVAEIRSLELPPAPREKADKANKDLAKAMLDEVRGSLTKGKLGEWAAFTGEQWREGQGSTVEAAEIFLDLVAEFGEEYAAAKDEVNGLDFSDLERRALGILTDGDGRPSALARTLHVQYRHVLVDEYQDINEIQDAILNLVSRECVAGERKLTANLFAVGDVKQSIFRFRLAEPRRFLDRNELFRRKGAIGRVIDLRENFRSRGSLLEAVNETFERLMTREAGEIEYDQTHRLVAGATFAAGMEGGCFAGAPIELHLLPRKSREEIEAGGEELETAEIEAMLVARRIREITGADGSRAMNVCEGDGVRAARFSDIVILLRSLRFKADAFADMLRKYGVPVHSDGGTGFFDANEVRDVLALLRILDNQQQDIPLAAVLRSPLANLPEPEESLARIRLGVKGEEGVSFHVAVTRYAETGKDELAARLRDFLGELRDWRDRARRRPLAELIWHIYESTGYLAFCAGLEDGRQRAANLIHLHERAGQFGGFSRQGLHRFIRFLQTLREDGDWKRPCIPGEEDEVVRIMSVHRSKGLEFPIVCLADIGKRFNLADASGPILVDRKGGLGMSVIDLERRIRYPSMAQALIKSDLRAQTLAEELRLLYVAMTRAKEHLILVGTASESGMSQYMSRWAGHVGKLPAEEVLGAGNLLDWIGPVYAATGGEKSKVMRLEQHGAEEVGGWENPKAAGRGFSERQRELAGLKVLSPEPMVSEEAEGILRRFERGYSHGRFSELAASRAATSLVEGHADRTAATTETRVDVLELPQFLSGAREMSAADRGSATHLVLEHLDFSRRCDEADVEEQIGGMVDRKLVLAAQAEVVDRGAIRWFLETELGRLIRGQSGSLLRELPFAIAERPGKFAVGLESDQGMDQVMVRGRIDLLVPVDGGFAVVDYKTDRVGESQVKGRAEEYRGQLEAYREAIGRIGGKKVTGIYLVFLWPRVVWAG